MQTSLKIKLSVFMFLQYFIWGSWYVSMGTYLANTLKFGGDIRYAKNLRVPSDASRTGLLHINAGDTANGGVGGNSFATFLLGDVTSFERFVSTSLNADRYFASEKLLAFLGIVGGLLLFALPRLTSFAAFYPALILYCASYVPTLALGNSLSLHHLADARRDFPIVKTLSAVGWIAGGVTLSVALKGEQSAVQFYLAGAVSIALGLFSLTLPHTPPKKTGQNVSLGEVLGLDALALLKKPSFAIFIACMFVSRCISTS